MKSSEIRQRFLNYFAERGHKVLPSSSLIPADPTLLLTAAGMVQFKPIFLGKVQVDYTRTATAQKCVRTTDIERVGHTARHLTFFEMLGNFSFGDYYKPEAIAWAWDLLTNHYRLDPDKLWISIFETDDEAFKIWHEDVGLPSERIVRLGVDDNFWSAGPTGPCGPSSEILYDQGEERGCGRPECAVGCDCDRWLEIWNLVFMQYNRDEAGELHPLPRKNIDTGMGLERIASILQGAATNFEIDVVRPVIDMVARLAGVGLGDTAETDVSLKIIADHLRAITFMISDGILPSNEGRGYVLRRLVRRAVRHGRLLGIETAFLVPGIAEVISQMSDRYPEIEENQQFINTIAAREEERFEHTLRQGLAILAEEVERLKTAAADAVPAETVFKLYDTYGFPVELTEEIAAESGLAVDVEGFQGLMSEQRERARERAAATGAEFYVGNIYHQVKEQFGTTDFVGYEADSSETRVAAIVAADHIQVEAAAGDDIEVFVDASPFYAERGGQIGDGGTITTETGRVEVANAYWPVAGLIAHRGQVVEGTVRIDQTARCVVDAARRQAISRNHTATHLLHWALRLVLGKHVRQAGSLVEPDRLRFDLTHHQPMTPEEIKATERMINEKILQDHPVRAYETSFEYAKEIGALAFFADKYGDLVRVVEIGNFSKELCGGIHVHRTSEIGFVKILGEAGIGASTRRIEAISGARFLDYFYDTEAALEKVAGMLGVAAPQAVTAVAAAAERLEAQERELAGARQKQLAEQAEAVAAAAEKVDEISLFMSDIERLDVDALRSLADRLRAKQEKSVVVLSSTSDARVNLLVAATPAVVSAGFSADKLVRTLAPIISGGGGGRADLAQAGGKRPDEVNKIFPAAKKFVEEFVAARQ